MLAKSAHNKTTLFSSPRILQKAIYKALFHLCTSLALAVCNLDKTFVDSFDC